MKQTRDSILWMRILDRRRGPNPPKLIVIDPRETATAKEADVHLALKVGTNVPVLNGLLNLMIEAGHINKEPDEEYRLWLTTGRVVYHFHTRTKTGRSKELHQAAPDGFVQISTEDATKYGIKNGDFIEVESRRGRVIVPARVGDIEPGLVFIPFHYGYWDETGRPRAANELMIMEWDPVSKQPHYKYAAVRIRKTASALFEKMMEGASEDVVDTVKEILNLQEA
jgi:anaerobic selenocysteine-containing dehydrogenase